MVPMETGFNVVSMNILYIVPPLPKFLACTALPPAITEVPSFDILHINAEPGEL